MCRSVVTIQELTRVCTARRIVAAWLALSASLILPLATIRKASVRGSRRITSPSVGPGEALYRRNLPRLRGAFAEQVEQVLIADLRAIRLRGQGEDAW